MNIIEIEGIEAEKLLSNEKINHENEIYKILSKFNSFDLFQKLHNLIHTIEEFINVFSFGLKKDSNLYEFLEKNISSEINANLVILNPQIGGNYIEGDLYQQRQEKEKNQDILDKLTLNINTYLESGATILFYGEDKDFKALFGEYNYIRYKSES